MKKKYVCAVIMSLMMMVSAVSCSVNADSSFEQSEAQSASAPQVTEEAAVQQSDSSDNYYITNNNNESEYNSYTNEYSCSYTDIDNESYSCEIDDHTEYNTDISTEISTEVNNEINNEFYDECSEEDDSEIYEECDTEEDSEFCEGDDEADWFADEDYSCDYSSDSVIDYNAVDFSYDAMNDCDGDVELNCTVTSNRYPAPITLVGVTVFDECGNIVGCTCTDCNLEVTNQYELCYLMSGDLGIEFSEGEVYYYNFFVQVDGEYFTHDSGEICIG